MAFRGKLAPKGYCGGMFGIRKTLQLGASVFGLSALLLLALPELFLDLLLLDSSSAALVWSMRMIGVTLVALAGNMWMNSKNSNDSQVKKVGLVMAIAATGLGVLTLLIPATYGWFTICYAAIGFTFGANYTLCLIRKKF
jgi:hypothetical protein